MNPLLALAALIAPLTPALAPVPEGQSEAAQIDASPHQLLGSVDPAAGVPQDPGASVSGPRAIKGADHLGGGRGSGRGAGLPGPTTVVLGPGGQIVSSSRGAQGLPLPQFTICWDNTNTPPFPGNFPAGDEIVDWGVKACGKTGVVRSFQIAYQTTSLDVSAGGPGAALTVAFYEGTSGNSVLGVETARYTLSGLPGALSLGTPTNQVIEIDLGNYPFCFADGQIGFGFTSDDGVTQPLMTLAPSSSLGTQNLLDRYSPGPATDGNFAGSFDMGSGMPFGSLYLRIKEDDGSIKADSTTVNGSGLNPVVFSEIAPAVLGTTWLTRVDLTNYPNANFTALVLSRNPTFVLPTSFGELFVDLTDPGVIVSLSIGIHGLQVPKDTFILGQTFHSQAAVFSPMSKPVLTNGIDVIPGF